MSCGGVYFRSYFRRFVCHCCGWFGGKEAVWGCFGVTEAFYLILYVHNGSPCGLVSRGDRGERLFCPKRVVVTTYLIIHSYLSWGGISFWREVFFHAYYALQTNTSWWFNLMFLFSLVVLWRFSRGYSLACNVGWLLFVAFLFLLFSRGGRERKRWREGAK